MLIALSSSGEMVIAGRCIQGASGATILACGLSLLTVGTPGEGRLRAVSLWGAAAGVGAAAGPLLGGVLVEVTSWQGLFWVDAGVAVVCMVMTAAKVTESRDEDRPRSIDIAGSVLVALVLTPIILALSEGSDWGWTSVATLGCLAVAVGSAFAFVAVEKRVAVPMLDLALLRNRILVASTIAILIGAGTINALMYLVSLYFQDPATLGLSSLEAGLATLPATAGLVAVAPFVPRIAARFGGRQVVGAGFAITAAGFAWIGFVDGSWTVSGLRPAARCRRHRDGTLQRAGDIGVDGIRLGGPGRGGLRRLQHGPLRRRGRCHGSGRVDLRQRHRKQDRRRPVDCRRPVRPASRPPRGRWQSSVSRAS